MQRRGAISLLVTLIIVLIGCSSPAEEVVAPDEPAPTTTTTTTLPPRPPELRLPAQARAEIGQMNSDAIVAVDPNGQDTTITVASRAPDGFTVVTNPSGRVIGFEWRPVEAGEWTIDIAAVDEGGLETVESLKLISRYPRVEDVMVVMGDSVAAGFGRDRSDFSGSDECYRSEVDAYGIIAADELIGSGALSDETEVIVVACAGATARSLRRDLVQPTNKSGDAIGEPAPQLDVAIEANPTIVTMTIGSGDLGLFDADLLTNADAADDPEAAIDNFVVDIRLESFERDLRLAIEGLVRSTDAHIVLTTWYDPTAADPAGTEGCRGQCFADVMAEVVDRTNEVIVDVVAEQRDGRVSLARLDGDADVWESGNGFGIDALRERFGPLQGFVNSFTGGSSATCAANGSPAQELVSSLDCVHPNHEGQEAIAQIVVDVLLSI